MLRTEVQRKTHCTACPVARVADVVGDPCSLLIVRDLLGGQKRFCELEESLAGISSRTLTNKLKRLEQEKVLIRKELTRPSRVEYKLTAKGVALRSVVNAMRSYGERYL